MEFHDLITLFSKLGWKLFSGYYASPYNWGIQFHLHPDKKDTNAIMIEKETKESTMLFDVKIILKGHEDIIKKNIGLRDYLTCLQTALLRMGPPC